MKQLGTRWVEVEDEDRAESIYKAAENGLVPYETAHSLHVWEERYVVDQLCYRIFGNFSNDEYIVEELV